jgi:uncharacterized protein RhaS with RHS repeats
MKPKLQFILVTVAALLAPLPLPAGTVTYTYDSAGRLRAASYTNGWTIGHRYDRAANRVRVETTRAIDTDADGMDDTWEQTYFGTLARDGTGDFDNDTFSDVSEFLAGTLPNSGESLLRITRGPNAAGQGVVVEWAAVPGRTYRLQYRSALLDGDWINVPGDVTATGGSAAKVDTTPGTGSHRFYRVLVIP